MRSPRARAALLAITVLAVSPPIGAAAAAPASASYGQLVRQIDHGAVTRADIDSSRQRVTVTLKSGHSEVIALPAGARAALVGRLRSHGIRPVNGRAAETRSPSASVYRRRTGSRTGADRRSCLAVHTQRDGEFR